jgi:hypothetical protein
MIRGRRNGAGEEKVVERRQRRMIKNRESAARSRARKQVATFVLNSCMSYQSIHLLVQDCIIVLELKIKYSKISPQ